MHPRREQVFRQLLSLDVNVLYRKGLWGPQKFDAALCGATVVFSPTLYTGRAFPYHVYCDLRIMWGAYRAGGP
jgi:hypothetical protein